MFYFYNQLFSNIILVVKYVNCQVTLLMFSFIFLLFRLCRDGSAEPRPKNSPLDCFCLTLFGTSFSNPSFPKHKNKSIAYAMDSFLWWAEMDSNHRTQMRTDLQSAAFSHSAIYPKYKISSDCSVDEIYYNVFSVFCQYFFCFFLKSYSKLFLN